MRGVLLNYIIMNACSKNITPDTLILKTRIHQLEKTQNNIRLKDLEFERNRNQKQKKRISRLSKKLKKISKSNKNLMNIGEEDQTLKNRPPSQSFNSKILLLNYPVYQYRILYLETLF